MAGNNEIEVPTEQAGQLPAPTVPVPTISAFPGEAAGRGLQEVGQAVAKIGLDSYRFATEALAQDAETEFQRRAEKIRDDYKQKFGWDAVQAHPGASAEMAKARDEIVQAIPNKPGRILFNNSSLRIYRYAQEAVDSHFEQQNRFYQFGSYKSKQAADLSDLRAYAADPEKAKAYEDRMVDRATRQYGRLSGDPEATDAEVKRIKTLVAVTGLRSVAERGGDLGAAMKKWGDLVPDSVRDGAEREFGKRYSQGVADEIFNNVGYTDANGAKDSVSGRPDPTQVLSLLRGKLGDEYYSQIEDKVYRRLALDDKMLDERAKSLGGRVRAVAMSRGGFDLGLVPPTLLTELNSTGSTVAEALQSKDVAVRHRQISWTEREADRSDRNMVRSAELDIRLKPESEKSTYTKDDLLHDLARKYPYATNAVEDAAIKVWDKWRKEPHDAFEGTVTQIAREEVRAKYGTAERRDEELARVHGYLQRGISNGSISKNSKAVREEAQAYMRGERPEGGVVRIKISPREPGSKPVEHWGPDPKDPTKLILLRAGE